MMRNNTVVEFVSGQLAEEFKMDEHDKSVSFKETSDIKYGAIGIIKNKINGIPQTTFIKYRVKIIWNNGELADTIIGVNDDNISRLSEKDKLDWLDFINEKENEADGNV